MNMGRSFSLFSIVLMLFFGATGASAQNREYGGRAAGVILNGDSVLTAGDTGELPSVGGSIMLPTPSSSLPGITTGMIVSSTSGMGNASQSSSTVSNVNVTAGGYVITATEVTANSQCICCPGFVDATCLGWISVRGLSVIDPQGQPVAVNVSGSINQTVNLNGGGTITFNEQIESDNGLVVNGIRINIGGINAVIASAQSTIICGTGGPTSSEVSVSGRTTTSSGRGLAGVTVKLTSGTGNQYTATSGSNGVFSFAGVMAGQTYVLEATHSTLTFPAQVIEVSDEISGIEIRAN